MRAETFTFKADDGEELFVYRWLPDAGTRTKAVLHIAHGMAEHAARYARVAEALTAAGYAVYADDHRGHGKTARFDDDTGYLGHGVRFERLVRDVEQLLALARRENPGLPAFVFGHSMGSYVVQRFIIEHGRSIHGAVLSATSGKPNLLASAGRLVARVERRRLGERGRSKLINELSFGQFNKAFAPNRTPYDWLSRDQAEVDKYIADPRCGFICSASLWAELLDMLALISRPAEQERIPKDLPVYIMSGTRDASNDNTKSVKLLISAYLRAGLRNVTHRFYPEGRHEMLNEVNRDEVTRDLVGWLDQIHEGVVRAELRTAAND